MHKVTDMRIYKARQAALKHIGSNNNVMVDMISTLEKKIEHMAAEIESLKARLK